MKETLEDEKKLGRTAAERRGRGALNLLMTFNEFHPQRTKLFDKVQKTTVSSLKSEFLTETFRNSEVLQISLVGVLG